MRIGAFLVLLVLIAPASALAQLRYDRGGATPLDRLLPEIRRSHPGQFYDAEGPMRGPGGQLQYRLKWMTPDGRIVWLNADARTGRVLGSDSVGSPPYYQTPPGYYGPPSPYYQTPPGYYGPPSPYYQTPPGYYGPPSPSYSYGRGYVTPYSGGRRQGQEGGGRSNDHSYGRRRGAH